MLAWAGFCGIINIALRHEFDDSQHVPGDGGIFHLIFGRGSPRDHVISPLPTKMWPRNHRQSFCASTAAEHVGNYGSGFLGGGRNDIVH